MLRDTNSNKVFKPLGFGQNTVRKENDFYPTPTHTTQALLDKVNFNNNVWECACGDGAISKVLLQNKYNVLSSDLVNRSYGIQANFLNFSSFINAKKSEYDIITNPPFKLFEEFIIQAKKLAKNKIAMLGRIQILKGISRYDNLFCDIKNKDFPLSKVIVFSKRVNNLNDKSSAMCFCWFIWDKSHIGKPIIDWFNPH